MRRLSSLNAPPLALPTTRQPARSQFPAKISVALTLPFQLKLALFFALFFQLSLQFNPWIRLTRLKHLLQPAAYVPAPLPRRVIMLLVLLTPCNARQTLLDLVLV